MNQAGSIEQMVDRLFAVALLPGSVTVQGSVNPERNVSGCITFQRRVDFHIASSQPNAQIAVRIAMTRSFGCVDRLSFRLAAVALFVGSDGRQFLVSVQRPGKQLSRKGLQRVVPRIKLSHGLHGLRASRQVLLLATAHNEISTSTVLNTPILTGFI